MSSINPSASTSPTPIHVAIIMDGNGRWALQRGEKERLFGHRNAVKALRETVEAAAEAGVKYLTLYAFSTENWQRPKDEIDGLMSLLLSSLENELDSLLKNNVRLRVIGDIENLGTTLACKLRESCEKTSGCTGLVLVLALSYSGRWEISRTASALAEKVQSGLLRPEEITQELFSRSLQNSDIPDPDLLIRTGGEYRVSNFLLWQIAYSELYFTPVLWPDFDKTCFFEAIEDFRHRERRFGKTSDQISHNNPQ